MDVDEYFYEVFVKSREIHEKTNGAFDPTVMPLVNFWGFGWEEEAEIDTSALDSLRRLVQFDQVLMDMIIVPDRNDTFYRLEKKLAGLQLDFSAIAKGYGVDIISHFLEARGFSNHFVEIGGEVNTMGKYKEGAPWKVGIEKPEAGGVADRSIFTIIGLRGEAVATSGNYRNYKEINGRKVVHTINPRSGYPEISHLLSTSVIAQDCMTADAYATAFMVMGIDSAYNLANEISEIEAYFIYSDSEGVLKTKQTAGFEKYIIESTADIQ